MKALRECSLDELKEIKADAMKTYEDFLCQGISINMARGRPSGEQLDYSDNLLNLTKNETGVLSEDGMDCRNYGGLLGIPECRRLFGEVFGVSADNVIACGSSSLNLMFDYFSQCMTTGVSGCEPWIKQGGCKFIAVVPGYDRHFAIAEHFGIEMISIPMTAQGPDMNMVEEAVKDPKVKGMFCVPKYSNPDGVTYSDETVERLASMKTGAKDFRIFWDEAYVLHDFDENGDVLANIFDKTKEYGNEDRVIAFASTSKVTFAGAGVSALAASENNIKEISARMTVQIISYDKINQLRHCYLYKSVDDIKVQMKKHSQLLKPRFAAVLDGLSAQLDGLEIASWNKPKGGYFISLDINVGSAKYIGELCAKCGLTLTKVGATYPYGIDPEDKNIRIAPSLPSVEELKTATAILCASAKIAACEQLEKELV